LVAWKIERSRMKVCGSIDHIQYKYTKAESSLYIRRCKGKYEPPLPQYNLKISYTKDLRLHFEYGSKSGSDVLNRSLAG
jgi:hypothetical protein